MACLTLVAMIYLYKLRYNDDPVEKIPIPNERANESIRGFDKDEASTLTGSDSKLKESKE